MRLYLVRHAAVNVVAERPSSGWHLSPEGRGAAEVLAQQAYWKKIQTVYSSPEPKAVATAQRAAAPNGLPMRIEPELREVERPWGEGYEELVRRYLADERLEGWEDGGRALARIRAVIARLPERGEDAAVAIVSHGLLITLYIKHLVGLDGTAASELWAGLRFPDVAVVDPGANTVLQPFGSRR